MAKYKCLICNEIIEVENIDEIDTCPICGVSKEYLELTEEEIKEENDQEDDIIVLKKMMIMNSPDIVEHMTNNIN